MTDLLNIYAPNDEMIVSTPINTGCRRKVTLMSEDYILVKFSSRERMQFPVGTRCGDFFVTKAQNAKVNSSTGGYDYEIQLDAYYWLWNNRVLKYVMPGVQDYDVAETHFSLTADILTHGTIIKRALDKLGFSYDGSPFRIEADPDVVAKGAKFVQYDGVSILDGIAAIAEVYECEWWVIGNAVYFGKCSDQRTYEYQFKLWDNVESISITESKETVCNRFYVFGSDRNLPPDYREVTGGDTIQGIVQRRLMLPAGYKFLGDKNLTKEEIVEKTLILDDVYPKTDLTVRDVTTYVDTVESDEGVKTEATFYRIKYDESFIFLKDYILPDKELHVIFSSGNLNGMDFAVKFNPLGSSEKLDNGSVNPDSQMLEIIVNQDYGRSLPDDILFPEVGDKFVIYNWNAKKVADLGLITDAENELLEEGLKAVEEYKKDLTTYACKMMHDWMRQQANSVHGLPLLGSTVNLIQGDESRTSRIIGYELDLAQNYNSAVYTCGEKISVSRLKKVEETINGLVRTGEKVKVHNSFDFLSKRYSDRTPFDLAVGGRLTAENGISSKNFAEGMTGTGYFIDAEGNVWIKSLHCREFLEVPELRYNRVDIQTGTTWSAPGGGLVESTESSYTDAEGNTHGALLLESGLHLAKEDGGLFISETAQPSGNTGWVNLKLEDGEFGAVEVGDICMGLWHFLDTSLNATADLDSNGNMAVKGFGTVYFEILEVSADNTRFRYKLRDGYPLHPQPGMNFVCYGNKAKKADGTWAHPDRQKSRYSTRTYERFLANVTDYTYGISNIMMQFGDLSNLTVNGKNLSGYSAYLKNVYFTGILEQIREESPLVLTLETIGSPYVTGTETCKVIAHVTQGFSEVPLSRLTFVTADEVGDEASYEAQTEQLNQYGYFTVDRRSLYGQESLMQIQVTTDDGKQARTEFVFYDRELLKGGTGDPGKDGSSYTENLIIDSEAAVEWDHSQYVQKRYDLSEDAGEWDDGTEYTMSFDYEYSNVTTGSNGFLGFQAPVRDYGSYKGYIGGWIMLPANTSGQSGKGTFVVKGKISTGGTPMTCKHIYLYMFNGGTGECRVSRCKLEKGHNDHPAWTPNAADLKGATGAQGSSYTDNILTYSRARKSIKADADGDTYKHYEDSVAHLVQGQQYTVSAQTNAASFSGTHGTIADKCVLWMCSSSSSPQGTVNQVISGNDMTTDGSKGHVFTWNHPTGDYFLRVNFYKAGTWWVERIKIETGANEHPAWSPNDTDTQGVDGAIKRGVDPWTKGTRYYDGKTGENGYRFLDWVYTEDAYHNVSIYMCIKPHLASDGTVKDTDGNTIAANIPGTEGGKAYWAAVSNVGNLYASTLFAPNASISFMTGQEIVLVEKLEDGTTRVYARLGTGEYPFWVGGETAETATYSMDNTGKTQYGRTGERHIVIDPGSKKILVHDDEGKLALEVSGEVKTPEGLMGGNGASSGTLQCDLREPASGDATEAINESIIADLPAIGDGAVIDIDLTLEVQANQTVWTPGQSMGFDPIYPDPIYPGDTGGTTTPPTTEIGGISPIGPAMPVTATATVNAYLERKVDATTWEVITSRGITAQSIQNGIASKTVAVSLGSGRLSAGTYRLRVQHLLTPGKRTVNNSTYVCGCHSKNSNAIYTINYNAQMASLLANGYFIGTGTANMAALWLDSDSVVNAVFRNSQAGIRLNGKGLYASLKDGQWNRIPLPLFRGCSWTDSDGKWQLSHVQSIDGQWPSLSVSNGVYKVTFPTSWKSLFTTDEWRFSDFWRINARINGTQQAFWSVNNFSSSGVDIHVMNNQGVGFMGAVWIEVEFLGIPEY